MEMSSEEELLPVLLSFWVSELYATALPRVSRILNWRYDVEIPYALPPRRFQDPRPLPPGHKYEKKEFLKESAFATQPTNDGQAQGDLLLFNCLTSCVY
jgi:hypothetical protein